MDEDDVLQALAYAMELEHRREVEEQMLREDPGYIEFLMKVENEHVNRCA